METEARWAEKAIAWVKHRVAFEPDISDADKLTPDEIAELRENRQRFLDYVERNFVGMTDAELLQAARGAWAAINWYCCFGSSDLRDEAAVMHVLESRGYQPRDLAKKWHSDSVAHVRAGVDRMISTGGRLERIARNALIEATDQDTGTVDWQTVAVVLNEATHMSTDGRWVI